jgi:hypothetical protein
MHLKLPHYEEKTVGQTTSPFSSKDGDHAIFWFRGCRIVITAY